MRPPRLAPLLALVALLVGCGGAGAEATLAEVAGQLAPPAAPPAQAPDPQATWRHPRTTADHLAARVHAAPDDHAAWLALATLSAREPSVPHLGPVQAARVIEAVAALEPAHPGLPAARAWLALLKGDLEAAAAALPEPPGTLDERWAALRLAQATGRDPASAAAAVRALAPAHPDACVVATRAALSSGDLFAAEEATRACAPSGRPEIDRAAGEVAWLLGDPAAAAVAWGRAGLPAHEAEALAQAGDPAWRAVAARAVAPTLGPDPVPPPVAAHAVWFGLRADEPAWVAAGVGRLEALEAPDPTARIALAAGRLAQGDPAAALDALDALDGAAAEVLRGRALAAAGDLDGARAALTRATRQAPGAPWAWRARAAVEPGALGLADPFVLRWGAPAPALDRPGDLLAPGPPSALPTLPDTDRGRAWADRARTPPPPATHGPDPTGQVLAAWARPAAEADRILADLLVEHPGVAGLLRERYAVRVRRPTERTPPP